jgi:hypothetical protein
MSANLSTTYFLSMTASDNLSVADSAIAVLDGRADDVADLWTIRLSKTSRVAGIALIGDPTTSSTEFVVIADSFKVIDTAEGYSPKVVFTAGLVGGVGAVGINGNVLIDGTIAATQVGANQIVTSAANIKDALITTAKISNAQITTALISDLAVTSAKISSLDAGKITTGTLRGIYLYGNAIMTKGSYLSSTCAGGATTLNIGDTSDFPASGTAYFIDSSNDRDTFTYTGKTDTTLTGCSGVLAHTVSSTNKPIVVPTVKGMYLSDAANEIRFFGDRGDGTVIELGCIGINASSGDPVVGTFGSSDSGCDKVGLYGLSHTVQAIIGVSVHGTAVFGANTDSNPAVVGTSTGDYGGFFSGPGLAPICLGASLSSAAPTHSADKGAIWVTSGGIPYFNNSGSTTWKPISLGIQMQVGTYDGDGLDDRAINIGLNLSAMSYVFLVVKNVDSAVEMVFRDSGMASDNSYTTGGAMAANMIQSFTTTGFTVGTHDRVNKNGDKIQYIVFYQA